MGLLGKERSEINCVNYVQLRLCGGDRVAFVFNSIDRN